MKRVVPFVPLALAACAAGAPLPPPPNPPPPVPWPAPATSAPPIEPAPDAFREQAPAPGPAVAFVPPKIESFALSNGIRVLLVSRRELPIVSVRIVSKVGAGDIPGLPPGAASFAGVMAEQGTKRRTALQLSDDFEAIGASHGVGIDWDSGSAQVKVLTRHLDAALELLTEVVRQPAFADAEVARARARRLAALQGDRTNPRALAQNALLPALYGRAHPYGHSLMGRPQDAKLVSAADARRAFERVFAPANVSVVVAGDVSREAIAPKLEARLGDWAAKAPEPPAALARPLAIGRSAPRIVLVDLPRASQSQVFVADVGVPLSTPDRDALGVMNGILGGAFSSRINLNLREKHAYTYGARSGFAMRHGPGPFTAGGAIVAGKTVEAVREIFSEIERMRAEEVSAEELGEAKDNVKLAMPGRFETVGELTGALADLVVYGLPLDEYATRPARVDAVTAADVRRVAQQHLRPDQLRVVVVGDRAALEPKLRAMGLGPVEVRDPTGELVK